MRVEGYELQLSPSLKQGLQVTLVLFHVDIVMRGSHTNVTLEQVTSDPNLSIPGSVILPQQRLNMAYTIGIASAIIEEIVSAESLGVLCLQFRLLAADQSSQELPNFLSLNGVGDSISADSLNSGIFTLRSQVYADLRTESKDPSFVVRFIPASWLEDQNGSVDSVQWDQPKNGRGAQFIGSFVDFILTIRKTRRTPNSSSSVPPSAVGGETLTVQYQLEADNKCWMMAGMARKTFEICDGEERYVMLSLILLLQGLVVFQRLFLFCFRIFKLSMLPIKSGLLPLPSAALTVNGAAIAPQLVRQMQGATQICVYPTGSLSTQLIRESDVALRA